MSAIVIPENQNLYPTPNEHVNFEFGDSIEEYRTARYLNNILRMFGPDVFLWGLDLVNITWTSNSDITFRFNNGSLIQDSTLIKILYAFDKSLTGLTTYTINNYYILIYTEFKFEHVISQVTSNPQQFAVKIGVYDPTNQKIYANNPDSSNEINWDTERNRLIFHCAPLTSPYDAIYSIDIEGNTYVSRGAIQDSTQFNYDTIEAFNLDGGII